MCHIFSIPNCSLPVSISILSSYINNPQALMFIEYFEMALITLFGLMLVLSISTITVGAPIKRQSSDDSKLGTLYGGVIFFGEVISK